jgi:hypothetical protein
MRHALKYALASSGMSNPDSIYEPDETAPAQPRVDAPVKLENRGTTQQKSTQAVGSQGQLPQLLLWSKQSIHKNTTAAKLRSIGRTDEANTLEKCHTIFTVATCTGCGVIQKFPNRCDLFFCAECQPRLSNDRKKAVEWWTREIRQPKHVVLTVKNVPELTKHHVKEFKNWFTRLRRTKFARNWAGGFYSIEVTNEGSGWHLHLHALINAGWIDSFALSEAWQKATNGFGKIVKVKDARQVNYLAEVTKYAVKGVQLAAWRPDQIATFIDAFTGVRTFGVFGELYGKRTQFAEWFKIVRNCKPLCSCGCSSFRFQNELEEILSDFVADPVTGSIPPPRFDHPEFKLDLNLETQFGPR